MNDPLIVIDRHRTNVSDALRDTLAGSHVFLLGGGPSANDLPLELLSRRGIWTMAVNNVAGHPKVRPQAFVCSDPPQKFSHSIWLDPAIMKFIPTAKMGGRRGNLRQKQKDGTFIRAGNTDQCPNVWGFGRCSRLSPDDSFFTSTEACWGNHDEGCQQTGEPKTVCTMLLAIRLLKFLGASRIYLVGVDFGMSLSRGYSFDQDRTIEAVNSNNAQFAIVNKWLCKMQNDGVFSRFGLSVYNCYQKSGLRAFPYAPFTKAIEEAAGVIEQTPDLSGWYEK